MPDDFGAAAAQIDQILATAEDEAHLLWPTAFSMRADGIWFQPQPSKLNPEPAPVWVCAAFCPVAETVDEQGAAWGLLLHWEDRDGRPHEWAVPRRLLHAAGNEIAEQLDDAGLRVGSGKGAHELLKQLLGRIEVTERKRCVSRTGWHQTEGGYVYVLPGGETFGPAAASIILQSDHVPASASARTRGTLAEWQGHVARYAVGNHRLGLFLAAAFAGPLLDVVTEPSGGLHLHGGSQTGKTTALGVAASVWGRADASGQIRTWRATSNGMEGVAAETCDALLPLDEIGQVDPREAGEIVYSLANESGKARANRDGSARGRRTWRLVFLSTGEIPLAVKMGERGIAPMAGQEVRLANIPADAGAGLGVFQELHEVETAVALSVHLRRATTTYYGTAASAFLEKLARERVNDPDALIAVIEKHRKSFLDKNLPQGADGQVASVARRLSLIAAAGELARVFGVLPWPEGEAAAAAAAGLKAWIKLRGGTGAAEDVQAVAMVRRFIEQHGESRFSWLQPTCPTQNRPDDETTAGRQTINRVGFRRETDKGWRFLIFPESWKSEVCRGLDPQRVAAVLHAAGFLDKGDAKHWAKKHRIPGEGPGWFYTVQGSILGTLGDE